MGERMLARWWAVAVGAWAGPSFRRMRRKKAPRALGLVRRRCAARRQARLARFWTRRRPVARTGPPRIGGSGQRPTPEAKGFGGGQVGLWRPPAARMPGIVGAGHPGTWVRSTPGMRERGVRRAQAGA